MSETETRRRCFHCLSYDTYHHKPKRRPQWHTGIITFDKNTLYKVWYCHTCYNRWIYRAWRKEKPKMKIKVLPSVIANKR